MSPELSKAFSKYLFVPYVDKGRDMAGWDCFGLYRFVLQERHGVLVPSYAEQYTDADHGTPVIEAHRGDWQAVQQGDEREGDGIVFTLAGQPLHCGYVIERGTMLHSIKGRGTCIERYTSPGWAKRIEGLYRWTTTNSQ